ncbi:MAG TPA: S9 family peptidase [Pyrinomonadaceae bacterium]|jgi:dipeptidyl-peptidase-4
MKKIQWLVVAIFALASFSSAQDKMLSIDDIFDPQKRVNFSGRPTSVRWSREGATYKQVQNQMLMRVNALTGESREFFDNKKLVSVLTQTTGFSLEEANKLGTTPAQQFNNAETVILINHKNDLYLYNIAGGAIRRLTNTPAAEEMEADFSPDDKMVSFVRGMNLFVVDAATGRETQLTRDGGEKILNGYLDWVYEEELYGRGQKRGYWWSPDSTHIAFLRTDETPVPKFVLPDDTVNDQRVENTDYPQAGDPNPLVRLGAVNVRTRAVRFADTTAYEPKDFLISRVTWSPDSQAMIYQAQNREQTFLDLNSANRATGKTVTVFRETSPAWVEVIDNPVFLKDKSMIWQSARSGFKHLYHYDSAGKMIRRITDGRWEVRSFYGVDERNGWVYFSATEYDPIGEQIYRIKPDGTGLTRLTKTDGSHSANFNPTFTHFVDNWSDVNTPTQTRLFRADGTLEKVLNENKVDALAQYKLGKVELMRVRTRDGFAMEAMMIKPPDFDPSKKYPVMSYTYSGPHSPSVRNAWGGSRYMWHQMLAQKGYIVWICDNRTASGKGAESAWKGYQNLGELELKDLEEGLDALRAMPFVDASRIGLWGWSYGGFMTSYALTHSKSFKMGIAGGTVSDWRLYDSIYTERVMKTPQNNPGGYDKSSVLKAAKDLSGRLLLIHGAMDDNVHMQNTTQLAYELQKAGKQFDLMIYPTQRHGVVNPLQAKHMYQMMTDYILKNL